MEKVTLNAARREEAGKGAARSLRREGFIPAVVYRMGKSESIKVNRKEMIKFLQTTAGGHSLINLQFPDGTSKMAIMKDYQTDPATDSLLHSDFFEVLMTEKIKAGVQVVLKGEAIGVKRDKGILEHKLREIDVECLPADLPSRVEVDVTDVFSGHSIHVRDIDLGPSVKIMTDPGEVVALVSVPAAEVAAEAVAVEGAAAAAAAAAPAEPEVIKKGKKEEAEGESK